MSISTEVGKFFLCVGYSEKFIFLGYSEKFIFLGYSEKFIFLGYSEKFTTGAKEDQFAAKKRKKGEAGPLHRDHSHSHHSGLRHLP